MEKPLDGSLNMLNKLSETTGTGTVPAIAVSVGGTLKIPTTSGSNASNNKNNNNQIDDDGGAKKKRKRPTKSEFCDRNDGNPFAISNQQHLVTQASGLAPVTPQGLVPVWVVGNTGMMIPANAFWMIPQTTATGAANGRLGNQQPSSPQIWALSPSVFNVAARPISSIVSTSNQSVCNGLSTSAVNRSSTAVEFEAMSYRRDHRSSKSALFDGLDNLEEGGLRASSSFSHDVKEHDNGKAIESLHDRVAFLKRLTGDIHDEVESHNRMLDRMGNGMDATRGIMSGTMDRFKKVFEKKSNRKMCTLVMAFVVSFLIIYYLFRMLRYVRG